MDSKKILKEQEYTPKSIFDSVKQYFFAYGITETKSKENTIVFYGERKNAKKDEFAILWNAIHALCGEKWFIKYCKSFMWYDKLNGEESCEDILAENKKYHAKYGGLS